MRTVKLLFLILAFFPINLFSQWTQIASPTGTTLYSLCFATPSTGYVSGSLNGYVIKTTDGGTSWEFQNTGANGTFYDILFGVDQMTGFVCGTSKQIIKTTNGGVNWNITASDTGTLYSLAVPTTAAAYCVGSSPTVIDKSTDFGNTWFPLTPPTTNAIRGTWFATGSTGWICGYAGTIMQTTDGGSTWIDQSQTSSYRFEKIRFHSFTTGYVVGSNGTMLKSTNSGTNWFTVNTGVTATLYDIFFFNSITGWAVGDNGTIIRTTNAGSNWYVQSSPTSQNLYAIHVPDANTGYIAGFGGVILKTTNGGGIPYQPYFVKFENDPITTTTNASNQCAWGDYDGDGLLDMVISTYNDSCTTCTYPLLLFHNLGTGFERVLTGPVATVTGRTFGVAWGDYDNDGKLDLFVSSGFGENNLLFHNEGGGIFTQITTGNIVNDGGDSRGCAWADYDRDGWLDLYVCNQNNENNFLYHNNQNGTFTKITAGSIVNDMSSSRGCSWGDYDNDLWPDLFVVNYDGQNDMRFHNEGDGTFTRIMTGPEVTDSTSGSGCSWGDFDNDGYLDLFVTNYNSQNKLYRNFHDGSFVVVYVGSPGSPSGHSYGTGWGDYDNDGFIDLFVATDSSLNALYRNNIGQSFSKMTGEIPSTEGFNSSGCAWGDYNNNGKLDLFATGNHLSSVNLMYTNQGNTGNYLVLKLKGCLTETGRSNNDAIGTRIKICDGNTTMYREVCGGMGMGSQNMFWQHIGLGSIASVDSVVIFWPSGNIQKLTNVAANQILLIDECFIGIPNNTGPLYYSLEQNYPNPFNPKTTINYSLGKAAPVKILVYDLLGRLVKTLVDATEPAGKYRIEFDGSNFASGIYIYKIETSEFTDQKKMVLIK
jgi:photosystem II stability/assembly factor-like uncharacterized protein